MNVIPFKKKEQPKQRKEPVVVGIDDITRAIALTGADGREDLKEVLLSLFVGAINNSDVFVTLDGEYQEELAEYTYILHEKGQENYRRFLKLKNPG